MTKPIVARAAYSIEETAQLLGDVSRQHLYNMAQKGEIRMIKLGRRVLIPSTEINRLLATPEADDE